MIAEKRNLFFSFLFFSFLFFSFLFFSFLFFSFLFFSFILFSALLCYHASCLCDCSVAGHASAMHVWLCCCCCYKCCCNKPEFLFVDQVTTIRSSVKKPDIPLMTDAVSKLQAIGKDTVARLKDLTAAAAASSDTRDSGVLQDFCSQCNSITTGKFLTTFVTSPDVLHLSAN